VRHASLVSNRTEEILKAGTRAQSRKRHFAGDILALHSDGITQASKAAGEEFGAQPLAEALWWSREVDTKAVIASLFDAVGPISAGERQDDLTVVVANCRENSIRI